MGLIDYDYDYIKRLITITIDNIKRFSLYLYLMIGKRHFKHSQRGKKFPTCTTIVKITRLKK
jgi:hypothetical protein